MAIDLNGPLSWTNALAAEDEKSAGELAMLHDLQGNILKSHGRDHTANLFLSFDPTRALEAMAFVENLGHEVTSSMHQLTTTALHKKGEFRSGPFVGFFLTAAGYDALGKPEAMPQGEAFRAGMAARQLSDRPQAEWQERFQSPLHAMLLLGAGSKAALEALLGRYEARIAATGGVVRKMGLEIGSPQFNDDDNRLEHFGYVDGRSQPLALAEDILVEKLENGGIEPWSPKIPLGQLITPCPGGRPGTSFGSFFVFRKLEQNVLGFKTAEKALEKAPANLGARAGASIVGRFENGTPIAEEKKSRPVLRKGPGGTPNSFDYSDDVDGLKCPLAAHIRKTNPRAGLENSKATLMARRGITYGDRTDKLNDDRLDNKPSEGVGLLFMSYQSSLKTQFEVTQRFWANDPDFPRKGVGRDPLDRESTNDSGPPPPETDFAAHRHPSVWGEALGEPVQSSGFVKMLGGAYFFAPSISFLKGIRRAAP